jgi:hypothetical protein
MKTRQERAAHRKSLSVGALTVLAMGCGSQGAAGPAGAPGEAGAPGVAGSAGPVGPTGPAGSSTSSLVLPPGGRLVAAASACSGATPIQLADVPSAGAVCYVPYASAAVPVAGVSYPFSTLTLTPTGAGASAIFDIFVVVASGSVALCWDVKPWASATARSDGVAVDPHGIYANTGTIATCENGGVAIASAIPARSATYLGSFYTTAVGTTQWLLSPDPVTGGTNNVIGLYNAYNRVSVQAIERELTPMWTYGNPTGTWQEENGSAGNRITILDGLGQSQLQVTETMTLSYATGTDAQAGSPGICADCTTPGSIVGILGQASFTAPDQGSSVTIGGPWPSDGISSLGLHYFQALDSGESADSDGPEWYGNYSSGLYVTFPD